jgi:alkanesulfonate monooxygenase SsuD/methylene tetrahydromethanopterin reductase-like flavin-dependent oxidoreductase (luciferase family)
MRADYDGAGLPFGPPKERFDRFAEALDVLRGVWSEGSFSFAGKHYQITDLIQEPKPVQKPFPKLMLPGGGPRMLRLAGRYADYVNLTLRVRPDGTAPDETDGGLDAFLDKIAIIREAAGDRFDRIELGTSVQQVGVPSDKEAWSAVNLSRQDETPQVLLGSVAEMADKLRHWRDERGLSYFILHNDKDLDAFAPVVKELAGS